MESPFENATNKTCALYLEPILNTHLESYQDVLTLSDMPAGPIANMVRRINVPRLSPFQGPYSDNCILVLTRYPNSNMKNEDNFMFSSDIPNVFGYLEGNGYKILDSLTTIAFRGQFDFASSSSSYRNGSGSGKRRLICLFRYQA
jgi:hypothetical protein